MSHLAPFPPDWQVGILLTDPLEDDAKIGFLPIVGMEAHTGGITAVFALPDGTLVRANQLEHPVICIVEPNADRHKVAVRGLEDYLRELPVPAPVDPELLS